MNDTIIFVSAGLLEPKKRHSAIANKNLYLNYGLLRLATILKNEGHIVKLIHGAFFEPYEIFKTITEQYLISSQYPLFLSIPSFFAIPWASKFCQLLKQHNPSIKIIVGGRWVVGEDGQWIQKKIPQVDLVVYGTAENRIEALLHTKQWRNIPYTNLNSNPISATPLKTSQFLEYSIVEQFKDYQPSIEISRGCGMGCLFCCERDTPLTFICTPAEVVDSINHTMKTYDNENITPYFEASYFRPSSNWAKKLRLIYDQVGSQIKWRCETRVEGIPINTLKILSETGLKVIDFGLESANFKQLVAMGKTSKPNVYLKKASNCLRACYDLGIWVKVNILLYAGETLESIDQTIEWLSEHEKYFKGVSVGSLIIYGHDSSAKQYLNKLKLVGVAPVEDNGLDINGYTNLHLSQQINYEMSQNLSIKISKLFMTDTGYYELKAFSYFPRSFSYDDFQKTISELPIEQLPFRCNDIIEDW